MDQARPQVGIGLFIVKDGKILLGRRKASHGSGEFSLPGGHLEHMETIETSVLRELLEEAGPDIKVKNLRFLCATNLTKYAPKHYLDIGMAAEWESGEPIVGEPHKLESWAWYDMDNLPTPTFGCTENYIEAYKNGTTYFPNN